jgi:Holliday junction resolvase RusA-like endonuclease
MHKIKTKAVSLNEAYRGRRFKTPKLAQYKEELNYLLPKIKIPDGKLEVFYRFGLSSKASDYDNCIKAFQDCLQDKYGFNDNRIYKATVEKVDVKKGEEFIEFDIKKL